MISQALGALVALPLVLLLKSFYRARKRGHHKHDLDEESASKESVELVDKAKGTLFGLSSDHGCALFWYSFMEMLF